jgi:hypothetical protein
LRAWDDVQEVKGKGVRKGKQPLQASQPMRALARRGVNKVMLFAFAPFII